MSGVDDRSVQSTDGLRIRRRKLRKSRSSTISSTTNLVMILSSIELALSGGGPVSNHMNYGTAIIYTLHHISLG
jgi:hypothetical protein